MNYYIADTHFGHNNILHIDRRPFADIYQMEETMVMLWNATVRKKDTVYILGDFCFGKADEWLTRWFCKKNNKPNKTKHRYC